MSAKAHRRAEGEDARLRAVLEGARAKARAELGSSPDGELEEWPDEPTGIMRVRAELNRKKLEAAAEE